MADISVEDARNAIKKGEHLPPEFLRVLHSHQNKISESTKKNQILEIERSFNACRAPLRRPKHAGRGAPGFGTRLFPGPPQSPTALMCFPGFSELGDQSFGIPAYGSNDGAPAFGTLVNPQPSGALPAYPCHKSSVLTRSGLGEISIAVGTANTGIVPGYEPEEQFFLGAEGLHAAGSISKAFSLPNIDRKTSVLQAAARISSVHGLRDAILSNKDTSIGTGTIFAVYGFVTVTLVQGLGFIFGSNDPASKSTAQHRFLNIEYVGGVAVTNESELDDVGFSELSTLSKYDPANDIFFISVEISVYSVISTLDNSQASVLADFRFAGVETDNQLTVFPENAGYSCGLQVQDVKLCGF